VDNGVGWEGTGGSLYQDCSQNTKLKRQMSEMVSGAAGDGECASPAVEGKRTTFQEEVVVIEFDKNCKIQPTRRCSTHVVPLNGLLEEDSRTEEGSPAEECAVTEGGEMTICSGSSLGDAGIVQSVTPLPVFPCDTEIKSSSSAGEAAVPSGREVTASIGAASGTADTLCSIKL